MKSAKHASTIRKQRLSFGTKCILCLVPSIAGLLLFYILPYIRVLYYSLINNQYKKEFVGLNNYVEALQNEYFRLAFLSVYLCF